MPATSEKSARVPKYCLHKPSGNAYVRIDGKVVYLGRYSTPESRERYGQLVAKLAVAPAVAVGPLETATDITVVEVVAAYLDFAQGYYQKHGQPTRTLDGVKAAIRPLRDLYGRHAAAEFSPLCLLALQNHLVTAGGSRNYVNKQIGIIKRCFKWAVSRELVPPHVFTALSTVEGLRVGRTAARETEPVRPVEDHVVDATLPCLPAVVADMIRFQRLTGARPGEVCQLRPVDVNRTEEIWTYRPESHKTQHHGRERIIYIRPKAQDVLRSYLLRDAEAHCFSPAESEQKRHVEQRARRKTRVQPSQRNRRKARPRRQPATAYCKDAYRRAVCRGIEKANRAIVKQAEVDGVQAELVPHWHPNQLRHAKATEVRRAFGLEAAQVILGHAKADVTQIYAERDAGLGVAVARQIG